MSALADIIACADPAMVIVTTSVGDSRSGCLVGFHSQTSIDPEQYCVWISKANHTYSLALSATHFGVHFVGTEDAALATLFGTETGDSVDKFADVELEFEHPPLIKACTNRIVLVRTALIDTDGDHVGIVGDVQDPVHSADHKPFRLSMASEISPGHPPEEGSA